MSASRNRPCPSAGSSVSCSRSMRALLSSSTRAQSAASSQEATWCASWLPSSKKTTRGCCEALACDTASDTDPANHIALARRGL